MFSLVMKGCCIALLLAAGCNTITTAQFKNHKIAEGGSMPSVDVNVKNNKNIVIAAAPNIIHYTLDGGKSWLEGKNKYASSADGFPTLRSSVSGITFLVHTTEAEAAGKKVNTLVIQDTKSSGKSWSSAETISSSKNEKRDPQMAIHPKRTKIAITWSEAESFGSVDPACHSEIYYSESAGGSKWSIPELLSQTPGDCNDKENTLHGPWITMDDEHKVFATWEVGGGITMDRSYDAGTTWLKSDMTGIRFEAARDNIIPGIGHVARKASFLSDNSRSTFQNSLYMVWSDQKNGADDTDIYFVTSIRRGDSWQTPLRVNKDPRGKHQFMPAMTVDPVTGVIYIVYYDRRNYNDNETDVYLAWSTDGGTKFLEAKISETPFTPTEGNQFTSYIAISAAAGVIAPVWVRMDEGKTSIMTTVVAQDDIIQTLDLPKIKSSAKKGTPVKAAPIQQKFKKKPIGT